MADFALSASSGKRVRMRRHGGEAGSLNMQVVSAKVGKAVMRRYGLKKRGV